MIIYNLIVIRSNTDRAVEFWEVTSGLSSNRRFAVKTILKSRLGDEASRRNFLAELQTWIDLPGHPHLAACRFFRTVAGQIAIFAEYEEGGSLAEWIKQRRLTRLDQILDVALQLTWGLNAVHRLGLIHQDVKPGNVLLSHQGNVKVTDFGLARARAMSGVPDGEGTATFLVSAGGMTPAYCSHDQAGGQRLSRKTDMWSWGLSVLEMFQGGITWRGGQAASQALKNYWSSGPVDSRLPAMPSDVYRVLRGCFQHEPINRPESMEVIARILNRINFVENKSYKTISILVSEPRVEVVPHDRRTMYGIGLDPRRLIKALVADGRDPARVDALLPSGAASHQAQAVADMRASDEARQIFERLAAGGRKHWMTQLAILCTEMAHVHRYVEDSQGALDLLDLAITILEHLAEHEGQQELRGDLARAVVNRAKILSDRGDPKRAQAQARGAMASLREEIIQTGRPDLQDTLDWTTKALEDEL